MLHNPLCSWHSTQPCFAKQQYLQINSLLLQNWLHFDGKSLWRSDLSIEVEFLPLGLQGSVLLPGPIKVAMGDEIWSDCADSPLQHRNTPQVCTQKWELHGSRFWMWALNWNLHPKSSKCNGHIWIHLTCWAPRRTGALLCLPRTSKPTWYHVLPILEVQ